MTVASRKVVAWVWLVFFLGLIISSVVWVSMLARGISQKRLVELQVYGRVSGFKLIDQDGKNVTLEDLRGVIWVADFVFTRCAGPCPLMSSRMAELQKALQGVDGVKLVSISVDPKHDRPELLKEYAKRYGAKPEVWTFLTGDQKQIFAMITKEFKMGVSEAGSNPSEEPIIHGTHFVLVDGEGRIRGYYRVDDSGLDYEGVPAIETAVKKKSEREDVLEKIVTDIASIKHASAK